MRWSTILSGRDAVGLSTRGMQVRITLLSEEKVFGLPLLKEIGEQDMLAFHLSFGENSQSWSKLKKKIFPTPSSAPQRRGHSICACYFQLLCTGNLIWRPLSIANGGNYRGRCSCSGLQPFQSALARALCISFAANLEVWKDPGAFDFKIQRKEVMASHTSYVPCILQDVLPCAS